MQPQALDNDVIMQALDEGDGIINRAADYLGVSRKRLQERIRRDSQLDQHQRSIYEIRRQNIMDALRATNGNIAQAARRLDIPDNTLRNRVDADQELTALRRQLRGHGKRQQHRKPRQYSQTELMIRQLYMQLAHQSVKYRLGKEDMAGLYRDVIASSRNAGDIDMLALAGHLVDAGHAVWHGDWLVMTDDGLWWWMYEIRDELQKGKLVGDVTNWMYKQIFGVEAPRI